MIPSYRPVLTLGLWCITAILLGAIPLHAEDFDLYFLGGQSNMEGFGKVDELPQEMSQPVEQVLIFQSTPMPDQTVASGAGRWNVFRPGHGTGFRHERDENQYSDRFGVEVGFAHALHEAMPDRNVAIIKYARNGSSIAAAAAGQWGCWEPDFRAISGEHREINQYDHFLATIRKALEPTDIDGDGQSDKLIPRGIVWMQGESDATVSEDLAREYQGNLKRLMDLMRAALRTDDLPVVVGRISDGARAPGAASVQQNDVWKYGDLVRESQRSFVEADAAAALVTSTDQYGYSDTWHYDSEGYLDLGRQFAKAMLKVSRERGDR